MMAEEGHLLVSACTPLQGACLPVRPPFLTEPASPVTLPPAPLPACYSPMRDHLPALRSALKRNCAYHAIMPAISLPGDGATVPTYMPT